MTAAAYAALRQIGARNPFYGDYRGSFAMIGYTGPGKPSFVKQVRYYEVYITVSKLHYRYSRILLCTDTIWYSVDRAVCLNVLSGVAVFSIPCNDLSTSMPQYPPTISFG